MKLRSISFLTAFAVLALCNVAFAQEKMIAPSGIFLNASADHPHIGYPSNSGFIIINPSIFLEAASRKYEIFTIDHFPLGLIDVTLHVEQFDVLRKDSRLVLGTKNGDVVTTTPSHILLRGSVGGDPNSHVYISIFADYAIGYIETSIGNSGQSTRYLIQPLKMSREEQSTMIVYKQEDVVRSSPLDHKWNCTSEELAANIPQMQKIFNELAKQTPEALPQIRKVHLLDIAIDCDYEYFQTVGSDAVRAQEYAITLLGAQSDIYLRDTWCGIMAGYIRVWTTDDPYPGDGTGDMLSQLVNYWNTNMLNQKRAAVLLYSSHGGGGLAYVGTLCSPNDGGLGFGVCGLNTGVVFPADGYIWDVDVSSHEFGHICGSSHTHNCGWNPAVDSCVDAEGSCYPTPKPVRGTIMSYCHLTAFGTELKFHPRVAKYLKSVFSKPGTCSEFVEEPVAAAGPDRVICPGSSVSLGQDVSAGTAPFFYSWRPAVGLSSTKEEIVTATPPTTTTYITSVTDGNFLRNYDTVTVTVQTPTVNAGGDVTICGVGKYILSGSATGYGPFQYQWIDSLTGKIVGSKAQLEVPVNGSSTYKLIVTDSIGCKNTGIMHIALLPKPKPSLAFSGATSFCQGDSVTISTNKSYDSYLWSNGKKTPSITVGSSGKYSVTVATSGVGCSDSTSAIDVTVYPLPAKPIIVVNTDTLISTAAASYQWYRNDSVLVGSTGKMLLAHSTANYKVVTTDENGCSATSDAIGVTVKVDTQTNSVTATSDPRVNIFPNPAKDKLTLEYSLMAVNTTFDLFITNLLGNKVYSYSKKISGDGELQIDVSRFNAGAYSLHYSLGSEYRILKFIKE